METKKIRHIETLRICLSTQVINLASNDHDGEMKLVPVFVPV